MNLSVETPRLPSLIEQLIVNHLNALGYVDDDEYFQFDRIVIEGKTIPLDERAYSLSS